MKQFMKRFLPAALMAVMLLCLTACGSNATTTSTLNETTQKAMTELAQNYTKSICGIEDSQVNDYITEFKSMSGGAMLAEGLSEWQKLKPEVGNLVSIGTPTVKELDTGYLVSMPATYEQRDGTVLVAFDRNFESEFREAQMSAQLGQSYLIPVSQFTFNKTETLPEKLKSAGVNLLVGMVVVFSVLIFIAWIISLFKYMSKPSDKKKTEKEAEDSSAVSQEKEITEEIPSAGDEELVAVITAAIAASAGTSPDGLFVRSIKRVKSSQWKRA